MVLFSPQSNALKNCFYLHEYNDAALSTDANQASATLVTTTIALAKMYYLEENNKTYNLNYYSTMEAFKRKWPSMYEFNIFVALPKIDSFMSHKYNWLQCWPHSIRYVNSVGESQYISYYVFEICYGPARISYPVVQATFSVYFVFGINKLIDPNTECVVRYFLEGTDEELIPYSNARITKAQIKSLLKKKMALSSLVMLGSPPAPQESPKFKKDFKKFIQQKRHMLHEICFHNNVISPDEISLFPYDFYIKTKKNCLFHEKICPTIYERRRASLEPPHSKYTYENIMRYGWISGEEKLMSEEPSSSSSSSSDSIQSSDNVSSKESSPGQNSINTQGTDEEISMISMTSMNIDEAS